MKNILKKAGLLFIGGYFLAGSCIPGFAFKTKNVNKLGTVSGFVRRCEQALHHFYPAVKPENINPAPVNGLCELWYKAGGMDRVVYFDPVTGDLIFGEIFSPDGTNLTRQEMERFAVKRFKHINFKKASFVWGTGKVKVILFTDPDCPFCARVEKLLFNKAMKNKIRVYVFLYPLTMIHPHSRKHAINILCSKNPEKTLMAYARKEFVRNYCTSKVIENEAERKLEVAYRLGRQLNVTGVPTLVIGNDLIIGADLRRIERTINRYSEYIKK